MERITVPTPLKDAICNNQLILFVGAGLSFNFINIRNQKLEGWSNLVKQILLYLKDNHFDIEHLLPLINKYEPIKVLDLIESDKLIPRKKVNGFIKDFFDLDDSKNNFELHKKLFNLSSKIITTNYDTAFEKAIPELRKNKAYKGKNYELTTHKDPYSSLLFKLHGCFEDIDSMVLFPKNYNNLYQDSEKDAEHSLLVLKNIILNKTILFIGTGMGDFQINNIFKEIKKLQGDYNQQHFIITNKPLDSSLNFLTPINIKHHSEIERIIDELIAIKTSIINNQSEEVSKLKEQLAATMSELEKIKQGADERKSSLEKEALKYFIKGLNFHLVDNFEEAMEAYNTSTLLKPDQYAAFNNWGNALGVLAVKSGKESLYHQAFDKFQKSMEINRDQFEALNSWGTSLANLAKTKSSKERDELYHQAFDKFQNSIENKGNNYEAFYNWGTALGNLAETKLGKEREDLYHQSFDKFQKSIENKSDNYDAFYNWGTILGSLAKTKSGDERDELYQQAIDKFRKSIEINHNQQKVFYNWGIMLGYLAKTKSGEEREKLYHQAFDKFQKAIEIEPNKHESFDSWGVCLGYLANTKSGNEGEVLNHEALEKFQKSIELGGSSYNLSCFYALKNMKHEALKTLKIVLSNQQITVDFILQDDDWKHFYTDEDFINLISKYKN